MDWYSSWIPMIMNIYFAKIFKMLNFFYYFCFKYVRKHLKIAFFVIVWANFNFWRMSNVYHICNISMIFEWLMFNWYHIDVKITFHTSWEKSFLLLVIILCAEITLTFFIIHLFIHFRIRISIVFISFLWCSFFWCVINVIVMSN